MLARKQEWIQETQEKSVPSVRRLQQPNMNLRGKCLLMGLFVLLIAIVATLGSEIQIRGGYDLVRLKTQAAAVEKENEALRIEIAKLKSSQRILQIAVNELGMVMPKDVYCASSGANSNENRPVHVTNATANPAERILGFLQHAKAESGKGQ